MVVFSEFQIPHLTKAAARSKHQSCALFTLTMPHPVGKVFMLQMATTVLLLDCSASLRSLLPMPAAIAAFSFQRKGEWGIMKIK